MQTILFDVEANGLIGKRGKDGKPVKQADKVHVICLAEPGQAVRSYHDDLNIRPRDGSIQDALDILAEADVIVGHNALGYDVPLLQLLYPGWRPFGVVRDTLVLSRLIFPWIGGLDAGHSKRGAFPKDLIGHHSIEAWGYRLDLPKGELEGGEEKWEVLTQSMVEYCVRDVGVLAHLWSFLEKQQYPQKAVDLEHRFAAYINRQMNNGVGFDPEAAAGLVERLREVRSSRVDMLREKLGTWTKTWVTPVRKEKKSKEIQYDPNSTEQVARALVEKFGWKPIYYTRQARAWGRVPRMKVEDIQSIPDELIDFKDDLVEWFVAGQRLGMLCEGEQSFMPAARYDEELGQERIYGYVNHNGARTGRCTHSRPNMNVPRVTSQYGPEMRALFRPRPGWVMVGADLSGIEGRMAGHYLARYDDGAFARRSEDAKFHTLNQKAWKLGKRQTAKQGFYAVLYGAQERTVSNTLSQYDGRLYTLEEGRAFMNRIRKDIPGLTALQDDVIERWTTSTRSEFRGLDGRLIRPSKRSAVLNALFQSAGAIVMKVATVIAEQTLDATIGPDHWAPMLHVHDEMQIEVNPEYADTARKILEQSFTEVREFLGLRVDITGEAQIGASWADTH